MSHLFPESFDSICNKCSKACYLYMLDYLTIEQLVVWLSDYKEEFNEKRLKQSPAFKAFDKSSQVSK